MVGRVAVATLLFWLKFPLKNNRINRYSEESSAAALFFITELLSNHWVTSLTIIQIHIIKTKKKY
jgi:hypothetical protein